MYKISVILPSLNVESYIKQCINSVINQTLDDIEIICVDAGSTDGTLEILGDYVNKDSRVKLIHSNKKSYGYQMNLGIKEANGEYIAIVETDDFIKNTMFEDLYNLSYNGSIDIVKGNFYHYYGEDNFKKDKDKESLKNTTKKFTLEDKPIFINGHPSIWAGIYKKKFLYENNIKFIEEEGGGWVDNPFFFETAVLAKSIIYTDIGYYYYRETNPNSSSNSLNDFTIPFKRMIENLEIINKNHFSNEDVFYYVYLRVFSYLRNVYRRKGCETHMDEMRPYIHKVMLMLNEDIILRRFNFNQQLEYYKYLSPLKLKEYDELSYEDYILIFKENNFLYKNLLNLNDSNIILRNENQKLRKLNNELLNSTSWRFTKPLRKFKKLFKKN